ncbi:MAG: leucine-rich repeat domain-containing protein [Alphaproteobacteria bacterium]|nr:leucine-rich repeat domain-containing protein [Alphaproteobacteria bacterium]
MRKSQFIFVLMLSTAFTTMARADGTSSYENCATAVGASNCVQIGTSGTYYALSGDEGNQTMTIYGTKGSESTAATVPNKAFSGKSMSTFPGGVTSLKTSGNVDIGPGAFIKATGLKSIDLTGVQTIGMDAFQGATGLTSIDLTGVQTIESAAFSGATGLTSVDLTGVQTIKAYAFEGATKLTSVDLTGVQTIGTQAFKGATGLTSIVISDSLLDSNGNILGYTQRNGVYTGINPYAFNGSGLNTIYCPAGMTCGNSFEGLSGTPKVIPYSIENGQIKAGGKTYASLNDLASGNYIPKRIYTIDEAEKVSKKTGNTFKLRYK